MGMAYDYTSRSAVGTIRGQGKEEDYARMEAANAAQRNWRPTPPPAAPPPPSSQPDVTAMPQNDAAYAVMPPEYNPATYVQAPQPAAPPSPQMAQLDAINNPPPPIPPINGQPMQPIAPPPQVKPLVDQGALQVRGPIEKAVNSGGVQSSQPAIQGQTDPIAAANDRARSQLDMMKARENQDLAYRNANMMNQGVNSTTREDDLRNRHYAQKAQAAGSSALNYAWGQDTARAETNINKAGSGYVSGNIQQAPAWAPTQPGGRNYIQEAQQDQASRTAQAAGQEGLYASQAGRVTAADQLKTAEVARTGAGIQQQTAQQKLEQEKRISDTSAKLLEAKTPEDREFLQQSILTMLGKDPKSNARVLPFRLEDRQSDMGTVMSGGSGFVILEDGKPPQIFGPGGQIMGGQQPGAAPAPAAPKDFAEFAAKARTDPRNKAMTDAQLKAYYDKTYGAPK